eukprot:comp21714_c0_seq1/m.30681 comp21714_c0_seq1/g.30681  ORF comp21714_c0_seq1/g.30681 comp21714_c0_seq1/m.30681 type:complete len:398 (-) comp21714_c0_seq1:424-1617(-)
MLKVLKSKVFGGLVGDDGSAKIKSPTPRQQSIRADASRLPSELATIDIDSSSSDEDVRSVVDVNRSFESTYRSASAAQEYTIIRTINVGSTAKVQLAYHHNTDKHVALKIMKKPKGFMRYLHREVSVHRQLSHRNICRLYDVIETPYHFVLVQEYLGGGDLFDLVPPNEGCREVQALTYLEQIVGGVAYMHARGVVHRDIKPENCVCDTDGSLKIIDFGAASSISGPPTPAGTIPYMAPEMFGDPEDAKHWDLKAIDMWAVGVVYFTLLTGRFPWAVANPDKSPEYMQYLNKDYAYRYPWHHVSPQSMFLLQKILCVDPARRVTAPELRRLVQSTLDKVRGTEEISQSATAPVAISKHQAHPLEHKAALAGSSPQNGLLLPPQHPQSFEIQPAPLCA